MNKIKGIKKIASDSKQLKGFFDCGYLQVNYDKSTNKAWADYHYDIGHNTYTKYHDSNIVNCGILSDPTTMIEIVQLIKEAL